MKLALTAGLMLVTLSGLPATSSGAVAIGQGYSQNFNSFVGTEESLPPGWSFRGGGVAPIFRGVFDSRTNAASIFTGVMAATSGSGNSIAWRESTGGANLEDFRLILAISNNSDRAIAEIEFSYDLEAWVRGARIQEMRLKYDVALDVTGRSSFETDILPRYDGGLLTVNPAINEASGTVHNGNSKKTVVQGKISLNSVLMDASITDPSNPFFGQTFGPIEPGGVAYLRWQISNLSTGESGNRSALGINNLSLTPVFEEIEVEVANIRINEVMSSNGMTIMDEDGGYEDWIELYNAGTNQVSLAGWGLSDDAAIPFRWVFPDVIIEPAGFLIVWASGKDRRDPTRDLHANFGVSADGEPVLLTRPDGVRADSMPGIAIPRDFSYGRKPGEGDDWFFFNIPTPGSANNSPGYTGFAEPPSFSASSGWYTSGFDLALSHSSGDVQIYYTLDGSLPEPANTNSTVYSYKNSFPGLPGEPYGDFLEGSIKTYSYSSPIRISNRESDPNRLAGRTTTAESTPGSWNYHGMVASESVFKGTTVRAVAVSPGKLPSEAVARSYFVSSDGVGRYSLPIVSVSISERDMYDYQQGIYTPGVDFDEWRRENPTVSPWDWKPSAWQIPANYTRREGLIEYPAALTLLNANGTEVSSHTVGVRIHGRDSRSFAQKSLRVYDRSTALEGIYTGDVLSSDFAGEGLSKLRSYDRIILASGYNHQDAVSTRLMAPTKVDVQTSEPAVKFINGEYWGVTFVSTRLDRFLFSRRYNIDADNVIMIEGPYGLSSQERVDEGEPEDILLYRNFRDLVLGGEPASTGYYTLLESLMSVDSFIDMHLMFVYLNNPSWHGSQHFKYWRTRETSSHPYEDGRWRFMVWDFDHFNKDPSFDYLGQLLDPTAQGLFRGDPERTRIFRHMIQNPDFKARVISRLLHHLNFTFTPDRMEKVAAEVYDKLAPEREEHYRRWGIQLDAYNRFRDFGAQRPAHVRNQMRQHLGVGADVKLTIVNSRPERGVVAVNGAILDESATPGVQGRPIRWTGSYFKTEPVTLTAIPEPGYRFVRWEEIELDAPEINLWLPADLLLTARFEPAPSSQLLHYWSFNGESINPDFSLGGGAIATIVGTTTEFTWGTGQGFSADNSHLNEAAGSHLRVNNPLGARIEFSLPTIGYENPVLAFEARRSNQGAGMFALFYTLDGSEYHYLESHALSAESPGVFTFDFSNLPQSSNNEQFGIAITLFESTLGGVAGNVRIDNVSLVAVPAARTQQTAWATATVPDTVYRFWSPANQAHFFTISKSERDEVMARWPDVWKYEGAAFHAHRERVPGSSPVYRFWSPVLSTHFYTISERERDHIRSNWPDIWTYEGVAWHAYSRSNSTTKIQPVYRFWSSRMSRHFYTISDNERNTVKQNWPDIWAEEGVSFFAFRRARDGAVFNTFAERPDYRPDSGIESPPPVTPSSALGDVYRFWSPVSQSHFFTISKTERDEVIARWPEVWTYEGVAFVAHSAQVTNGLPVYRFWSPVLSAHFYTISERERDHITSNWPDTWIYEGIAWYAYARAGADTDPVYRFRSTTLGRHFYTISGSERNAINQNWPDIWNEEGIAFHAFKPGTANDVQARTVLVSSGRSKAAKNINLDASPSFVEMAGHYEVIFPVITSSDSMGALVYDLSVNQVHDAYSLASPIREIVVTNLAPDIQYWMAVMTPYDNSNNLDLAQAMTFGRFREIPPDPLIASSEVVDPVLDIAPPIELIMLPIHEGTYMVELFCPEEGNVLFTDEGLEANQTHELQVPDWNKWYKVTIRRSADEAPVDAYWTGYIITH